MGIGGSEASQVERRMPEMERPGGGGRSWNPAFDGRPKMARKPTGLRFSIRCRPIRPLKLHLVKSQSVGFGQELNLEGVSDTIFVMQVEMKPTLFGKLVSLLYHAPIIAMTVRTGETILEKRMVPAMAKRGFLFNPLVLSNADVLNFYAHKGATADAVSFSRPPLSWGQLSGTITVNIYRLQ